MRLSRLEMETIITFNEAETEAEVFTHNKAMKKRLSGLCKKHPDEFRIKFTDDTASAFIVPKKRITISAPRSLTPEQREQAIQNLKK